MVVVNLQHNSIMVLLAFPPVPSIKGSSRLCGEISEFWKCLNTGKAGLGSLGGTGGMERNGLIRGMYGHFIQSLVLGLVTAVQFHIPPFTTQILESASFFQISSLTSVFLSQENGV